MELIPRRMIEISGRSYRDTATDGFPGPEEGTKKFM
jgi:hypothetical protein